MPRRLNKIRLGSIEFINSLPVDLGLLRGTIPSEAEIIQGSPAALNEKMLSGDLDLGPISVFWYAQHQEEWLLLPELSISSESGVQSVLLFSRHPFAELKGKRIALTGKGRTTPALLSILCQRKYGFMPAILSVLMLISFSPFYGNGRPVQGEVPGLAFLVLGAWLLLLFDERGFNN